MGHGRGGGGGLGGGLGYKSIFETQSNTNKIYIYMVSAERVLMRAAQGNLTLN